MSKSQASKNASAAEPKINIDSEVTRCIRQHARTHIKTEVCGVLIGEKVGDTVEIRSSIEASQASQGGAHVTFTQEAWEEIYRVKDERYPDARIVGWYHSHPGFGVFLSEHDMFIQQNFFSAPDQVAWVYDPHTDEEGCFGWVNGAVHRIQSLAISDQNGDGVERTPKHAGTIADDEEEDVLQVAGKRAQRPASARMNWIMVGLGSITMLFVGFAICFFFFPHPIVAIPYQDPYTGKIMLCLSQEPIACIENHTGVPAESLLSSGEDSAHPPASVVSPFHAPAAPVGSVPSKSSTAGTPLAPASTPAPASGKKP